MVWSTVDDESENCYLWEIVAGAHQQADMSDPMPPATMVVTPGMDQDNAGDSGKDLDWWVPDSCVGDPFHDDWSFWQERETVE